MGLQEFLTTVKAAVPTIDPGGAVHIVIGNESCDLDSAISAITYAYFLYSTSQDSETLYLPILNIPQAKFHVRLELLFFLGKHGIHEHDLIFVDGLDLVALTQGNVKVTLVDHHVLVEREECLRPFVVEVLDHRPQDGVIPESWNAEITKIGSCCSLVARRLLKSTTFEIEAVVAELLLGTILADTGNMSVSDNIGTPADQEVLDKLKTFLPPNTSGQDIFDAIRAWKFDLSSLTVGEMLHKDLKVLRGSHITVAMSSITMDLEYVLSREEFLRDTQSFCSALPCQVLVIMTVVMGEGGVARRCIAIFSQDRVYREQVSDALIRSENPNLDLQPLTFDIENLSAYDQKNLRVTRKGVLPLVRDFLAGEDTPQDENSNAASATTTPQDQSGSPSDEEEARQHINLAKAQQSDVFRTSSDRYDLAAVGTEALISPTLSSDSEGGVLKGGGEGKRVEESEKDNSELLIDFGNIEADTTPKPQETDVTDNLFSVGALTSAQDKDRQNGNLGEQIAGGDIANPSNDLLGDDILQNHMPYDLLCPGGGTDSPLDPLSMPTSGPTSGQGSKVPSYPDTPPNSFMEPSGAMFFKETQLPSFNSQEMVERIKEKKALLSGHVTKSKSDNFTYMLEEEGDGAGLYGGACSSGGAGSLISPAVPQNSYMDLSGGFDSRPPGYQLPSLTNRDFMERVNEKRSQFDWSTESLDGSTSGVELGGSTSDLLDAGQRSSTRLDAVSSAPQAIALSVSSENVPYTPQNSYVGGGFDSFARSNLPSMNSAEMVSRIKAKQSAMFGSGASSSRVSRSSHGSDDSGGCRSPDVILTGKSSRGASLDSPQGPYTPQNSYRDGLNMLLDGRNKLPDLNEVAERLSVDNIRSPRRGKANSGNNSGCGSRDEENLNNNAQPLMPLGVRQARHSSSQSDSQNTMSDVDSLMSVSTDVGTPSENLVAAGIAGFMKSEMGILSRKDTTDSDVFTPARIDSGLDGAESGRKSTDSQPTQPRSLSDGKQGMDLNGSLVETIGKDLFSPVEKENTTAEDMAYLEAAENIVALSIAAALDTNNADQEAMRVNHQEGEDNHEMSSSSSSRKQRTISFNTEDNEEIELSPEQEEDTVSDQALNELAFELANELIQNVLDDFPFNQETVNTYPLVNGPVDHFDNSESAGTERGEATERNSSQAELREDVVSECSGGSAQDSTVLTSQSIDSIISADMKLEDNQSGSGIDLRKLSASSESSTASSERKRSRETDSAMTILEHEEKIMFPESRVSKDISVEEEEEIMHSFPGRKFSKSEDFPARRYSRDDSSRRSSRLEDSTEADLAAASEVETQYLPSMDPLQGNLDIIAMDNSGISQMTDVDREVVEGESFRKISGQEMKYEDPDKDLGSHSSHDVSPDEIYETKISKTGEDAEVDEILSHEATWQKPTISKTSPSTTPSGAGARPKKKIRVSFSEDFDDELGDFHVQQRSNHHHHLRSPPPPPFDPSPIPLDPSPLPPDPSSSSQDVLGKPSSEIASQGKEVYLTSAGRISIAGEEDTVSPSARGAPSSISDPAVVREHMQVGVLLEAARDAYDQAQHVLEVFEDPHPASPSSASIPSSAPLSSAANPPALLHSSFGNDMQTPQHVDISSHDHFSSSSSSAFSSLHPMAKTSSLTSPTSPIFDDAPTSVVHFDVLPSSKASLVTQSLAPSNFQEPSHATSSQMNGSSSSSSSSSGVTTAAHNEINHLTSNGATQPEINVVRPSDPNEMVTDFKSNNSMTPQPNAVKTSDTADPVTLADPQSTVDQPSRGINVVSSIPSVVNHSNPTSSCDVNQAVVESKDTFNHSHPDREVKPSSPVVVTSHPLSTSPLSLNSDLAQDVKVKAAKHVPSHARNSSSTSFGPIQGAEYKDEWQDDTIADMAGAATGNADILRKKIVPDIDFAADDDEEDFEDEEDVEHDNDMGELEWENDTPIKSPRTLAAMGAGDQGVAAAQGATSGDAGTGSGEGGVDSSRWKRVSISGGQEFNIDMLAVEPYKNVLSHGGYYEEGLSAIIVFYGCHLPSRRRENYSYIMNHLFHYVIHTLDQLVANDYVIIYFHGSTPRKQMPSLGWLKRCYQSIDRKLKKNLKGLFLVHPTLWLRTVVTMIRPFISSKFSSKLQFVKTLEELNSLVPLSKVNIPDPIVQLEEVLKHNPQYLEELDKEEQKQLKEEKKKDKLAEKERKKKEKEEKKEEKRQKKMEKKREKEEQKIMKKKQKEEKTEGK